MKIILLFEKKVKVGHFFISGKLFGRKKTRPIKFPPSEALNVTFQDQKMDIRMDFTDASNQRGHGSHGQRSRPPRPLRNKAFSLVLKLVDCENSLPRRSS